MLLSRSNFLSSATRWRLLLFYLGRSIYPTL